MTGYRRPKVAVIVCGGTLTALSRDPFEIVNYGESGSLSAAELIGRCASLEDRFDFVALDFPTAPSFDIALPQWLALCRLCDAALREQPDIAGFVLTHGTGTLEETAFFLSLVWDQPVPITVTGAQRPASALGSDGYMNFYQAVCAAVHVPLRDTGVMVVTHGEVHLPAEVTKTTTFGLDTFRSPEIGPIAQLIGGTVNLRRRPLEPFARPLVDWRDITDLPRVDIIACYSGADETAINASIAAGARGLVTAGFAPGYVTSAQALRLQRWIEEDGGRVIAASRAMGPVPANARNDGHGFIPASRFLPQKARILLQLALSSGLSADQIAELFAF